MKIAVVGCGALGSYYGAKLAHSGQEVHFLLRSDYDAVRRRGVIIQSPDGNINVRVRCARLPGEIGVSDLVVIGLKTTANARFRELLTPLVGPATAILTLQNGLGNEEQLASLFSPGQILGGLCFVCLNRIEPGVIRHVDHGMVVLGEFGRWPEPRTHEIAELFKRAGIVCKVTDNLARAHWEKLVWNVPFNGLGVGSAAGIEAMISAELPNVSVKQECLTTDRLLSDPGWERLVRELMLEVIRAANALGHGVSEEMAEKQISRTRTMGAYKASTIVDFERNQPLELESLFEAPLREAKAAGVAAPRLERLVYVLGRLAAKDGAD